MGDYQAIELDIGVQKTGRAEKGIATYANRANTCHAMMKIIVGFLLQTQNPLMNEINLAIWDPGSGGSQAGLWQPGARVGPRAPGPLSIQFRCKSRWQPR